jgi:hypothetical protein
MPACGKLYAETPDLPLVTVNADMVLVQDAPEEAQDFLSISFHIRLLIPTASGFDSPGIPLVPET